MATLDVGSPPLRGRKGPIGRVEGKAAFHHRRHLGHPTSVDTDMIHNLDMYSLLLPRVERPTRELSAPVFDPSDEARSLTGVALPVDAYSVIK